jgi:hypothetical protein
LLLHENFADGIMTLNLTRDPTIKESYDSINSDPNEPKPEEEKLEIDDETFLRFALSKNNIADYGLSYFFEVLKDLVLSREIIETLYRVIIRIARQKLKPI